MASVLEENYSTEPSPVNREKALKAVDRNNSLEKRRIKEGWRWVSIHPNHKILVPCDKEGKPTPEGQKRIEKYDKFFTYKVTPPRKEPPKKSIQVEEKTLHLPLKSKWYKMIESGEKKEEYREIKEYWTKRLLDFPKNPGKQGLKINEGEKYESQYTHIRFRYGYTSQSMLFELKGIKVGRGKPEWGAPGVPVFILELGKRRE